MSRPPQTTKRPTVAAAEEILGGYFCVLDHGFVSLVDYMGSDESIESAARVSYGHGTRPVSRTRGLIRYLRRHLHTTPSEMVEFKFHCSMPIFVARQWVRHRTACLAGNAGVHVEMPAPAGSWVRRCVPISRLWRLVHARHTGGGEAAGVPIHLSRLNEDTGAMGRARLVDVVRSGTKPVVRMVLEDGRSIDATADHRFLFADGWSTLRRAADLRVLGGRAVWTRRGQAVYVDGASRDPDVTLRGARVCIPGREAAAPSLSGVHAGVPAGASGSWAPSWHRGIGRARGEPLRAGGTGDRAGLLRIADVQYLGPRETYDIQVEGPYHNFVANGIVTHNSVNEYSGRYSLMPLLFYSPEREVFALQSQTSNQGRAPGSTGGEVYLEAMRRWTRARTRAGRDYEWMVGEDVARELARIDLPLSTYTQWYWKIDLHNLLHFLLLRIDDHAQWEIREFGRTMAGMVKRVAPLSYEAWMDYQVLGARFTRGDIRALARLVSAGSDGLAARSGSSLTDSELTQCGLSPREIRELKEKLTPREAPEHDLDLGAMLQARDIEAMTRTEVPAGEPSGEP